MAMIVSLFTLLLGQSPLASQLAPVIPLQTKHVWHTEGITLYDAPSRSADSVGTVAFGDQVVIIAVLDNATAEVVIHANVGEDFASEGYDTTYTLRSTWVKVANDGHMRYALTTYLTDLPPPEDAYQTGFILDDYLKRVAEIVDEQHTEQTDEFCSRSVLRFANGMHYTFTDFGPCEQCGYTQTQLYLPGATWEEGFMMALHFFSQHGLHVDGNSIVFPHDEEEGTMVGMAAYGAVFTMRIIPQEQGIMLVEDLYL